ncbi:S41 family peptidase [Patescibacteria group bacterium]|nr:S41 family peptidase [Patescibacteria group bacterium]MBU1964024.1 S41 family peptidase [Patescibacteria group bacterium]
MNKFERINVIKHKPKKSKGKIILTIFGLIFLILVGFSGGYITGVWDQARLSPQQAIQRIINTSDQNVEDENIDFRLYWKVWDEINENFYKQPVAEKDMFYGSLMGLTASLQDPYSIFLDPELTEEFSAEMNGAFDGIGAEIGVRNNELTVIAPLPDTPAQKAGLRTGDIILKIDDTDTLNMSLDQAIKLIRGEKGTPVVLTVIGKDEDEIREIEIIRDTILVDSVRWEILKTDQGDIGYIEIIHFSVDTEGLFNQAVNEILLENPEGLIVDLRNNPGGYLDSSINIASKWIEDKPVLYEEFSDGSRAEYNSNGSPQLKGMQTVVLINEGSASASEIIAGALQDYSLATLVGKTTFGKGSVQDYKTFDDGSSLKLTIAKWLTPNLQNIDEVGITPDIEVERTIEDIDADIDPQLDEAKNIIINQ